MKKVLPLALIICLHFIAFAQQGKDTVTDLKFNPALYYSRLKNQPPHKTEKYLIGLGNYVVHTDTLPLPFIDDFSTNKTPGYNYYQNHVTDSFFNVIGGCLVNEGVTTLSVMFNTTPSWQYYWDTANQELDSTANPPMEFTYFGPSPTGCFSTTPQTVLFWPPYYYYTFDSIAGFVIDSTQVLIDTITLNYAPVVYFALGDSGALWFDNYAYINNTYPINPPTIGVATLDGLNQYGLPFDSVANAYGGADSLTSLPIDLSALNVGDSVYLSFFFEPQGLGDYPDVTDSLIVEFRDIGGNWNMVWADTGFSQQIEVPDTFQQVLIEVDTLTAPLTYFYNTFQFRFRNKASIYGNNNHWHLDYVKLDQHRTSVDTVVHDMSFTYPFPTILQNYTQEPAFFFDSATDLSDSINLQVRNLDPIAYSNPPATNFKEFASESYPISVSVAPLVSQAFDAGPYNSIMINPSATYSIPGQGTTDSLVVNSEVFIDTTNSVIHSHDTLYHTQTFTSVMAYDDGSAEKAYGLTGVGELKFAYEFILPKPDTLWAFQVMFAQVEGSVANLVFDFDIWDTLQMNNVNFMDSPIVTVVNQTPVYIDSENGFATYLLDTPIIVSGKIYLGWAQDDPRRLQVGYDMNSQLGRPHMYIYTNGEWTPSPITVNGSPMMRLIFSSHWWGSNSVPASVSNLNRDDGNLQFFPNPTAGVVNLRSSQQGSAYEIYVINTLGQTALYFPSVSNQFDIGGLTNGVYIISARNLQNGTVYRGSMVKTSN